MGSFELYFSDLTEEAQQNILECVGVESAEDMNWDVFPITEIEFDDNEFDEDDEEDEDE